MNKTAQALGRLAKGKPKTMSRAAIAQRKRAGFKKGNKAAARKSNTKRLRTDDPPRGGSTQDALVGGDS